MRAAEDRIVEYLRFVPRSDRATLAEQLDLPAPTVATAVRKLLAAGQVVSAEVAGAGGPGRPRQGLRLVGPVPLIGLVTWEADRLSARLLGSGAEVLHESDVARPAPEEAEDRLVAAIATLGAAAAQAAGVLAAVVISTPAPSLRGHGAPPEHVTMTDAVNRFPVTSTVPLEQTLAHRSGVPVLLENDANLAALGERTGGRRSDDFISITLNRRGFGGALVVHGALVRGARGYAGEFAHLQVDADGPVCVCGSRGCLWTAVRAQTRTATSSAYTAPLQFLDLPALADAGDLGAARMLRDIGRTIGAPVAQLCTLLDPDHVVVDSTIGAQVDHVIRGMRESMSLGAPPAIADHVAILRSDLGDRAELLGALDLPLESARRG